VRACRIAVAVTALAGLAAGCGREAGEREGDEQEMPSRPIEQVLEAHTEEWMAIPGVVGTGIGECAGQPCIRVFVVEKTPELERKLPARVEGYVVDVVATGEFRVR
jgi:hypothetical protein